MNQQINTISKIISDEFKEIPLKVLPVIEKGFVNLVFQVETESNKFIFRTNDFNSLDEYEKEKWAAARAIGKQIPTPQILKIGVYNNQAYSIQKYVEGIEGRNFSADKKFIWKKLGEYARQIHDIKIGGFGLKLRDMTQGNSQTLWLKYLDYNVESLNENDELLKLGVLTIAQSLTVKRIFENLKSRNFQFGLNHGDLSLKNTIVDDNGRIHLIDWGSAEASIVPHHDLIQLMKVQMEENDPDETDFAAFLEGCGICEDKYEEMLPDLKSLLLLRAFDKLRWALDWKIAELKNYVSLAKTTVERYLQ